MTKTMHLGAIAGALLATTAFVTTPALAIEGDVDVNANTGGADVRVDTNRPKFEAVAPEAKSEADVEVYAEDTNKDSYADDDDGTSEDRDDNVDIGGPGATTDNY